MGLRKISFLYSQDALQYAANFGSIFGGSDIIIRNNNNSTQAGYFTFPNSYIDTTGRGINTFTGASTFTELDIEVFKLS